MWMDIGWLAVGLVLAAGGGELFVGGTLNLARALRVPAAIVGATVAAFATSGPELSVAIQAGLAGAPEVSLGDALGSNVVNIALILGVALLLGPMRIGGAGVGRDLLAALVVPPLTLALGWDGELGRLDALVLLAVFCGWIVLSVREALQARTAETAAPTASLWPTAARLALGLGLLLGAGKAIVLGAEGIGHALGWSQFVIGGVLVAIGTSMPELATTVISRLKGHDDVGLGTVLGSNVFNGAFVVAVAALLHPIRVDLADVGTTLAVGIMATVAVLPLRVLGFGPLRGLGLLALYAGYLLVLLRSAVQVGGH